MTLQVNSLPGVGAEVQGINLAHDLDAAAGELRNAFAEHGLLFFRDQSLTEENHIAVAEVFGDINVNRFFAANPDYPQIAMVTKEPEQIANIGGGWHTDHSYDLEPALGSILVARELPPEGGDTWFASMYKAYDSLSEGLKRTLENLNAVHSARHVFGSGVGYDTEKKTKGRIGNAAPLLTYLYEQAVDEANVTKFQWAPGSVAFWDNRATWHFAQNDYQGKRRVMHRITIDGCALKPARH
jgi:taurine dioxygenase